MILHFLLLLNDVILYIFYVFKSLNETVPSYMYGKASFSCYAPRVWNKLPAHIKLLLLIVLRNNNTVFHDLAFNCFLSYFNTIVFSYFFILSLGFIANVCLFLYLISRQFNFIVKHFGLHFMNGRSCINKVYYYYDPIICCFLFE